MRVNFGFIFIPFILVKLQSLYPLSIENYLYKPTPKNGAIKKAGTILLYLLRGIAKHQSYNIDNSPRLTSVNNMPAYLFHILQIYKYFFVFQYLFQLYNQLKLCYIDKLKKNISSLK